MARSVHVAAARSADGMPETPLETSSGTLIARHAAPARSDAYIYCGNPARRLRVRQPRPYLRPSTASTSPSVPHSD
jgi:hypothetical protein